MITLKQLLGMCRGTLRLALWLMNCEALANVRSRYFKNHLFICVEETLSLQDFSDDEITTHA